MVGGGFATAGGVPVNGIARCNPDTDAWTGLGSGAGSVGGGAIPGSTVLALPSGEVIAAGAWTSIGGLAANHIARYTFPGPLPAISAQPQTVSACPSSSAAFSITATGSGPFTYQWRKGGVPIDTITNPTAATSTLTLTNVQPGDAGLYDCTVTAACSITSNQAQLLVDPSDLGKQGGLPGRDGAHDNNDFIVFIDAFFNHDPGADVGRQGGLLGSDCAYDNNDFVVFIDLFFAGCP